MVKMNLILFFCKLIFPFYIGNLIATGEYSGHIKVYDIKRKAQLRLHKNHTKAVHALNFTDKDNNLFSGSDDLV